MNASISFPFLLAAALLGQAPVISLDRPFHAFGRLSPKVKVSTNFQIRNAGDGILELRDVQTSCGCTTALPEKRALQHGESTTLEVQYDPQKDRGLVHRSVSVFSNDPKLGRVDLELVADVTPSVMLSEYSCYFQGLLRSDRIEKSVRCFSTAGRSIQLKHLDAGSAPFLRGEALGEGKDLAVKVKLDASKLPENVRHGQQSVIIRTDDPDTPEMILGVYWALGDAVRADPPKVAFDPAPAGILHRHPLLLRQLRGKAFRILDSKVEGRYFKVEGLIGTPAVEHALAITLTSDAPAGIHTGSLAFTLDDPDQRTLIVDIMALLK